MWICVAATSNIIGTSVFYIVKGKKETIFRNIFPIISGSLYPTKTIFEKSTSAPTIFLKKRVKYREDARSQKLSTSSCKHGKSW